MPLPWLIDWEWTDGRWLLEKRFFRYFWISISLLLLVHLIFWRAHHLAAYGFAVQIPLGVFGGLCACGFLYLWLGMYCYWLKLDHHHKAIKTVWLLILTFGLWYGAVVYFFVVYLAGYRRAARVR